MNLLYLWKLNWIHIYQIEKTDINKIKIECNMLNELEDILNIEIYYNPETTVLESNLQKAKTYNLITKKEV